MATKKKKRSKVSAPAKTERALRTKTGRKTKYYRPYKPREKKVQELSGYKGFQKLLSAELKQNKVTLHEGRGGFLKTSAFIWKQVKGLPFNDIKENIEVIVPQYIDYDTGKVLRKNLDAVAKKLSRRIVARWGKSTEWWEVLKKVQDTVTFPEYIEGNARINFVDATGELRQIFEEQDFRRKVWKQLIYLINTQEVYRSSDVYVDYQDVEIKDDHLEVNFIITGFSYTNEEIPDKLTEEQKEQRKEQKEGEKSTKEIEKNVQRISKMSDEDRENYQRELQIREQEAKNKADEIALKKVDQFIKLVNMGVKQSEAEMVVFGRRIS